MGEKIYIIGAGTIGKALAVSLKLNSKDVTILRGSVDDGSNYEEKISLLLNDGSEIEATIEFSSLINFTELKGLIILTNKSYGNASLAEKLKGKVSNSPLVILQNGLGVEQPFIDKGFSEIYRCVLFVTSQNSTEGKISYKPIAISPIGTIKSKTTNLNTVVSEIDNLNFKFKTEKNIQKIIWEKAIANCVFNSICPLLEIDNGVFHREATVFDIAKRVIKECVSISTKKGIDLTVNEIEKRVLTISKLSDGQFISTLQDIINKRKTEIDTLNFEIVRMAEDLNFGNLVQETRLLGELTKLKSELNQISTAAIH
jgi:2-dehydropantoate 2-reductase